MAEPAQIKLVRALEPEQASLSDQSIRPERTPISEASDRSQPDGTPYDGWSPSKFAAHGAPAWFIALTAPAAATTSWPPRRRTPPGRASAPWSSSGLCTGR